MKRFIIYMLCLGLPIFVGMASINYFVDPANVFHTEETIGKAISILKSGHNVMNLTNYNERELKKRLAEMHKGEHFDYIILGSSRMMQISSQMLDRKNILNLGVSGVSFQDIIAFYEICKENKITTDKFIIGIDPSFFNANNNDTRWGTLGEYYSRFSGEPFTPVCTWDNLYDISYFKSSLKSILKAKKPITATDKYENEGSTLHIDGSIYYDKKYRTRTQSEVDNDAKTMAMRGEYSTIREVSALYVSIFQKMIDECKNSNTNIIIYKLPFHPAFYKKLFALSGVVEQSTAVSDVARKNGIPVMGSYNPSDLGYNETAFYDGLHPKREIDEELVKRFNGLDKKIDEHTLR